MPSVVPTAEKDFQLQEQRKALMQDTHREEMYQMYSWPRKVSPAGKGEGIREKKSATQSFTAGFTLQT